MVHSRFGAAALACLLACAPVFGPPAMAQGAPAISAGTIVLRDLSLAAGAFDGKLGSIEFTGLSRDGATISARTVKLERLTLTSGMFDADLPSLVITDFEGPASAVDGAMSGQLARVDWIAFLSAAKAVRVDAPKFIYRLHDKDGEQLVTTTGIVFESLSDGVLGAMTLATQDSAVTGSTPEGNGHSRVGITRYEKIDLRELLGVFVGGGSGEAKTLIESGTSQAVELQTEGFSARIGSTRATGFLGRAPTQALTYDDIARAIAGEVGQDALLRRKVVGFMRDLVTYFSMRESGATDMEFISANVPVTVAEANFNGVGLGAFDLFELKDIASVSPSGNYHLGRFAVEGFDWRSYLDRVFEAADTSATLPPPALQDLPKLGAVRFENFESNTPQGPVAFDAVSFETSTQTGRPANFSLLLKRLKLQLGGGEPAEWRDRLLALGYGQVIADGQFVLNLDAGAKTLTLERSGISIDDAGSISATVHLGGVDPAVFLAPQSPGEPVAQQQFAMRVTLKDMSIEAADSGLLPRFYASVARDAGVSPDAIRDGMAAEIRSQVAVVLGDALSPGSADAVGAYLRDPGRLTIKLSPRPDRPPLTLAEVMSDEPPLLADRLTISIEASK